MIDLQKLREQLTDLGIDIHQDPVECASDWATQILVKGEFGGHSIRELILEYCFMTNRSHKFTRDDDYGN